MVREACFQRRDVLKALSVIPSGWIPLDPLSSATSPLVFSCSPANDLYRVLASRAASFPRYNTPEEAIAQSPRDSGVLVLAEGYPTKTTQLDAGVFETAKKKELRLYVEFPSFVPGLHTSEPRAAERGIGRNLVDRVVVTSSVFGPSLQNLRLLDIHDCRYVPVGPRSAHLVLARVAGFDTAVYGLPQDGIKPILFTASEGEILIATTKLSQVVTGRYAPTNAWRFVWDWILSWLSPQIRGSVGEFIPAVGPTFGAQQPLPQDAGLAAFHRGVGWFIKGKLFVDRSQKQTASKRESHGVASPRPGADGPVGAGSGGVQEGFSNTIEYDGSQLRNPGVRNDCTGETSMAMAFSFVLVGKSRDRDIASNLNDCMYVQSPAESPRYDPKSASFGLLSWWVGSPRGIYWGDDNARSMLGTIAAEALLRSDRWDEPVLRCLLANLRTTGRLGFREDYLDDMMLDHYGWRHFYDAENVNYAPHFEAYLWACFLWAYDKTHYLPFLKKTRNAVRMMLAAYPNQWRWTNGLQQERARMLLPLAWLIRVEDNPDNRQWLKRIAKDLVAFQDECGAIREELGSLAQGLLPAPKSNDDYGTNEAPLIQQNGDPVCDLLYTSNFAFLGLHEAAAATGESFYLRAEDKLAELLCRIQVHSSTHPELDGAWFRGFDYKRWDYWASNADAGYGVWSIETGWTQAWITSVLALRHLKTSFWDLTANSRIGLYMDKVLPALIPTPDNVTGRNAIRISTAS